MGLGLAILIPSDDWKKGFVVINNRLCDLTVWVEALPVVIGTLGVFVDAKFSW